MFNELFNTFHKFGDLSGCRLNIQKSQAFHIGNARNVFPEFHRARGLCWPTDYIVYLGIKIPIEAYNIAQIFKLNLESKIPAIGTVCRIWSQRQLTVYGKITIIKSLIIPRMLYPLSCIPCIPPKSFLKEVNTIIYRFLWGSLWERCKRRILINTRAVSTWLI